jgi:phosphatidylglycerol lysyltransferase
MATGVPPRTAARAGFAAIAVGQATGAGALAGALVRLRLLPGLPGSAALKLSLAVALTFLLCLGVLAATALALRPPAALAALRAPAALLLALALCAIALPPVRRRVRSLLRPLGWTAIDTGAAACVLWLVLPPGSGLGYADVLPAYLLALGAGLLIATPAGLGGFEAALFAALPGVPAEDLVAAILAYRIVYVAAPALVATAVMAAGPGRAPTDAALRLRYLPPGEAAGDPVALGLFARAARPDGLLALQGTHGAILCDPPSGEGRRRAWLTAEAGRTRILLGDPAGETRCGIGMTAGAVLTALVRDADIAGRRLLLYRAGAGAAVAARRAGMCVVTVGREAWIDPRRFDPSGPACAGLRRKLRRALRAGVRIATGWGDALPLPEMEALASRWSAVHGRERGLSMGRFERSYVARQRVFLAHAGDRLVAFVTFHDGAQAWTLDLMRHDPDMPDGTMHALVAAAIAKAGTLGLPRLSLAGAPLGPAQRSPCAVRLLAAIGRRATGDGLARFKDSFAPRWQTLYAAGPGRLALVLGLVDTALIIRRPPRLPMTGHLTPAVPPAGKGPTGPDDAVAARAAASVTAPGAAGPPPRSDPAAADASRAA